MAVVEVLNTGRARDQMLATSARNIWLFTSMYDIDLVVTHIPGVTNVVADLLSRWQHNDQNISKLNKLVIDHQWLPVHIDHTILNTNMTPKFLVPFANSFIFSLAFGRHFYIFRCKDLLIILMIM